MFPANAHPSTPTGRASQISLGTTGHAVDAAELTKSDGKKMRRRKHEDGGNKNGPNEAPMKAGPSPARGCPTATLIQHASSMFGHLLCVGVTHNTCVRNRDGETANVRPLQRARAPPRYPMPARAPQLPRAKGLGNCLSGGTTGGDWNPLDACNAARLPAAPDDDDAAPPPDWWYPTSSSCHSAATMPCTHFSRSSTWRSLGSLRSSRFAPGLQ